MALRATGFSRVAFSQPVAVYKTGFVPCRCCKTNWLFPGAFLNNIWWSATQKKNFLETCLGLLSLQSINRCSVKSCSSNPHLVIITNYFNNL